MDSLKTSLKNLGFNAKEIEIYIALLELGHATYTDLARATSIKRTTLYTIVNKMHERGITHFQLDTGKISAIAPEQLFTLLQGHTLQLHKLLPQLTALTRQRRSLSRLKFYNGVEAIKQAYQELERNLPKKDRQIRVISDVQTWDSFWKKNDKDFPDWYLKANKRAGYQTKILFSGTRQAPYNEDFISQYSMSAKYLPKDYKNEFDMEIRSSSIIITDLKSEQPYAIKIISTELAKALGSFFEFTWDQYR